MKTTVLTVALGDGSTAEPALAAGASGAPEVASIRALLLDPDHSRLAETWIRLDRDNPSFGWSPELDPEPSPEARVEVVAGLTWPSGATSTVSRAIFDIGARWQIGSRRPLTFFLLADALDWRTLSSVVVRLGRATAEGNLEDPITIRLRDGEAPPTATLFASQPRELAFETTYFFREGGSLRRPIEPVPGTFLGTFLRLPAPPASGDLRVAIDGERARDLPLRSIEAILIDSDGLRHSRTWASGDFEPAWQLRLPAEANGVASARLSLRIDFEDRALPTYVSPQTTVLGSRETVIRFFGVARFTAAPDSFEAAESVRLEVTEPAAAEAPVLTPDHAAALVVLPGDAEGAPLPGDDPEITWNAIYQLGGGNETIVPGSATGSSFALPTPFGAKTFSFLPVWNAPSGEIRSIHLSCRNREEGAGWRIEGTTRSLDLRPDGGVATFSFPVRDPSRATVVYSGRVITSLGSSPIPETVVAGTSMAVGGVEPWLSVTVDPTEIDWDRVREVRVRLVREGEPAVSGTLRFTAPDGPRPWGFFGASASRRIYDVEAIYALAKGTGTLSRKSQTGATFVLPPTVGLGS